MKKKIIFWIATGLLSVLILFSSGMYVINNEMVQGMFASVGFPLFIIYPLAFLNISGSAVITLTNWTTVKEWAYTGFFFCFILAIFLHLSNGDVEQASVIMTLVLLVTSYVFGKKIA
mgnify:CR=1 FL=1|tara:strand:+ start:18847 stop:19197 length:351 start_codon:yes stop_codon:yes gene_type:complete